MNKKKKISRKKLEKRKRVTGIAIIVVVLGLICTYAVMESNFNDVTKVAAVAIENTQEPKLDVEKTIAPAIDKEEDKEILPYLAPYYERNEDTIGWIKVNNTFVDYPVVYFGDNDYYITHNFEKEISKEGAVFLDFRCDIEDFSKTRNIILYGHRMKDDTMFKSLINFKEREFFEENTTIKFDTIYEEYEWEIFSVFKTNIDFYYINTEFSTDKEWLDFMKKCQSLSLFERNVKFYPTDIILTLSTCTVKNDERLVVMARLK